MKHYVITEDEYRRLVAADEHPKTVMVLNDTLQAQTPEHAGQELFQVVSKLLRVAGSLGLSRRSHDEIHVSHLGSIKLPEFVVTDESVRALLRKNASIERLRQTVSMYLQKTRSSQIRTAEGLLAYQVGRTLLTLSNDKEQLRKFSAETLEELIHSFGQKLYGFSQVEITQVPRALEILAEHGVKLVSEARAQRQFSKIRFWTKMDTRSSAMWNRRISFDGPNALDEVNLEEMFKCTDPTTVIEVFEKGLNDREIQTAEALTLLVPQSEIYKVRDYFSLVYNAKSKSWVRSLRDGVWLSVLAYQPVTHRSQAAVLWAALDERLVEPRPEKEKKK